MNRPKRSDPLVAGCATAQGTNRLRKRFAETRDDHFYRPLVGGAVVSSLGMGTYLGDCDDAEDARYASTAAEALAHGVNLLDTAINYRCQRSERALGDALRNIIGRGAVLRDEVVVCTKGGYIPLDRTPPATKEGYRGFLQNEYYGPGVMSPDDVVAGGHCLTPRYLTDQIQRSKRNLGLASIDIYYLHNPEQQLDSVDREKFQDVMRAAFSTLEDHVTEGSICTYGCATWQGFRAPPGSRNHLSLQELVSLAREVGGATHHFSVVQLPVNLAMTEAVRAPTQMFGTEVMPLLEVAHRLNVAVVGSATLMQSQLTRALPPEIHSAFPGFSSDARRAIAFAQSLPITSALVGMKSKSHLEENLQPPLVS
ncbi:MAG TPA: aldo/keto reductase [Gemmatimonadaceae bacterium]|nr:aldo/keto reductase [Gemmatimonadaceae bacterium]